MGNPRRRTVVLHRDGRVVAQKGGRWTSYGPEDGLIDAPVALLGARDGTIWAAGSHERTAATARFDGRGWTREIHGRFSWGVDHRALFESRDGSVWFGAAVDSSGPPEHRDGILQFRAGEWIHHHQPGRSPRPDLAENPATLLPASHRPEPIEKFTSLGESRDGRIWAGRNVIVFHDGHKWTELTPATELRLSIVESMLTTREGDLWIGTRQYGALRYDGRRWKQFQGRGSLLANSVRSMAQTADGSVWVATDRGISRFDGQAWTDNVLPAQLLIAHDGGNLKAAPSGSLWINRQTIDWNRRGWPKFTAPAAAGEFWTACYRPGGDPPRTVITSGPTQVSQPGNLSILWSGAAAWREPDDARLQFSFRLDDQPWSPYTSAGGQALFTLPHGPHRFSVRARDEDYNVDPTPATLDFVVLPPVWRQAWFIALMCVLGGLVATQSIRVVRERARLRRSNLRLASEITARERTEEALRNVLRHARTLVMHADVTAPANWDRDDPRAVNHFGWNARFPDEAAAQEVLPLEIAPGEGYPAAWSRARHPADREPMTVTASRALASGAPGWQQEFRCIDRHGRLHWFDQTALIEAVAPDRWRITAVSTDITGRKRAEEAHLTSEERLSTVFHLSPTPICIVRTADNHIVDVNEAFCEGTGYRHDELVGRTPAELNLWSDPAERAEIIRKLRDAGTAIACKLHGRRKSGAIGVGLGSVARIALNGEEHFLWLILDITEQERAEEARRESEGRFRQVTENIDEVFWLTDPAKQEMIYISPAYQRVWGRTCESLYAQPQSWLEAIHPEDRSRIREAALALQATGGYHHEYRILRPDGAVRWIRDRAFPIKDADGRVCRIAGVAEDITARHQLEDQLRQAQKMESLGTLAGGIAHDFNNILTGVLGSAELARLTLPANHPVSPWIENITSAGNRARTLVQQILTFGRQHESEMVPRKLQPVVEEALRLLRTTIPAMVPIESRIHPACPAVIADETQIHQVVMNLCTNAWHALGEEGGQIEVTLEPAEVTPQMAAARLGLSVGPHVRLTVRDNGRGMTPEILARIFEPFFTTKKQGHGTGLGLAVVHGIVQGHHGAIFAQSTPGAGTQFEVFLPAMTSSPTGGPAEGDQPFEQGAGQEILLVDDDASALAGLRMQLEHLGYRVTAVSDPRMALLKFRSEKFDLVLTDYAMAEYSGQDLAAMVLASSPDTPILLASGLIGSQQVQRARALGIREVLRKPVPLAELARAVAQHLNPK